MAWKEDTNSPLIITIGAVSGLLLLVLMFGVEAWFNYEVQTQMDTTYSGATNYALTNLRNTQKVNISNYRWVDRRAQIVAIPVEEAMDIVIANKGKLPSTQPAGPSR